MVAVFLFLILATFLFHFLDGKGICSHRFTGSAQVLEYLTSADHRASVCIVPVGKADSFSSINGCRCCQFSGSSVSAYRYCYLVLCRVIGDSRYRVLVFFSCTCRHYLAYGIAVGSFLIIGRCGEGELSFTVIGNCIQYRFSVFQYEAVHFGFQCLSCQFLGSADCRVYLFIGSIISKCSCFYICVFSSYNCYFNIIFSNQSNILRILILTNNISTCF